MSLKRLCLVLFAFLLIPCSAALAQTPPSAPETPSAPNAPMDFEFYLGGGSFLGIYPEDVTRENMSRFNLREARGVAIKKVIEGSPAEKAGLKKDDVVLRFNGEEVTSVRKLNRLINEIAPDHTARLTISRNGSEQEVSVTLGKRKEFSAMTLPNTGDSKKLLEDLYSGKGGFNLAFGSSRRIGISTNTLTKQLADFFGVAGGTGVLVSSVKEDSPAAKAGLKAGDVITEVDGEKIDEVGDLSRAINRKNEGDVTLSVLRDKSHRTIRVTPEKSALTPMFSPEIREGLAPRVGGLYDPTIRLTPNIKTIRMTPNVKTIVMPRISIKPGVMTLLGDRAL